MKKLFTLLVVVIFSIVSINFTYSFEDDDNSIHTINYLIKYVDTKTSDINKMQEKYNLNNDEEIINKLNELNEISKILLKTKKTWEYNEYISKIVLQLKNNNNALKEYLKAIIDEKKTEAEKYKVIYSKKIKPITEKINDIVINIASKLMQKEKINYKDKQIISLLYQIKQKIDKQNNLTDNTFNTKKDIQNYIISNFNQITFHFGQIKDIVKK